MFSHKNYTLRQIYVRCFYLNTKIKQAPVSFYTTYINALDQVYCMENTVQ